MVVDDVNLLRFGLWLAVKGVPTRERYSPGIRLTIPTASVKLIKYSSNYSIG